MKKIYAPWKRTGKNSLYNLDEPHSEESQWVFDGAGTAYGKWDGCAAAILGGRLFRRRAVRSSRPVPEGFLAATQLDQFRLEVRHGHDVLGTTPPATKIYGWYPVLATDPEKHWRAALQCALKESLSYGTYELVGPGVQKNPHRLEEKQLIRHDSVPIPDILKGGKRTLESIRCLVEAQVGFEGVVYHHSDGRMVKVTREGFGLPWPERSGV